MILRKNRNVKSHISNEPVKKLPSLVRDFSFMGSAKLRLCSMCFPELSVIICNLIMSSSLSESLYSVVCTVCLLFCLDVLINKL